MKNLETKYNHLEVEKGKYQRWIDLDLFKAYESDKKPYTIVIPPPNVTGKLHLGHAWDNTLQDIIARYKRMQGYDMLYLPGMDHAGIATQAKVEQRLKEQGLSRYDLKRDGFLTQAWAWKEEYATFIRSQWAKLGNSLDYSRERFTLDEGLNKAVNKVFVDLYNDGLIYQGYRIINWDPQAKTALSNIEVIHKEVKGNFYTFKYLIVGSDETLAVATTRPETMFGDVCLVVHPKDERFMHLIGKKAINPANHQELIIIGDSYIDMEFGTGAMKCTPAHDPNDYQIALRHQLDMPICMNEDGTMNELALEFKGLDRFQCRKLLVEKIKEEGNLISIEEHIHQVGHSERTDVIVEPYLSKQWFVKMKPLADDVLKHQAGNEKINFYPARFEKTFTGWLENIEDWCISRQLWWGHRIPAYYHKETKEVFVSEVPPKDMENYIQDEDVLDTWFSSALWPFSTLGWPEITEDFTRYYPTDCMVTGYDIIFFWVARMAFQARYFTKQIPFKDVLIHGLIRDEQGRKMSKSLGNGIDPMDVIDQYGVDALRFFLTTNSTPGQDMRYIPTKVEASWNFINKIWNAARYVIMNIPENFDLTNLELKQLSLTDEWILASLHHTLDHVTTNMERYEFALVGNELYRFVWDDFCNWYIEFSKSGLQSEDETIKHTTISVLVYVLDNIIKMLHPFMPFVTEEIFLTLYPNKTSISISEYPICQKEMMKDVFEVNQLIEIISTVRQIKVDNQLKPSLELDMVVYNAQQVCMQPDEIKAAILYKMCKVHWVSNLDGEFMIRPIQQGSIGFEMDKIVNKEEEIKKLMKEQEQLEKEIHRCTTMLQNPNFKAKASPDKVKSEETKLSNYQMQYDVVTNRLLELKK